MKTVNVIVPAFNEEKNIQETIFSLKKILETIEFPYRIIIVNDSSEDNTREIVEQTQKKNSNIILINRKGNHGLGRCINRGFEELRDGYVVIVMADLADDVNDIPKMVEQLENGADLICGSRYTKGGYANHKLKIKGLLSRILGLTLKFLTGIPTLDATNAFKMYKTEILNSIGILRSDNYASGLEVLVKAYCSGLKIKEIPTLWKDRSFGTSHFKIIRCAPEYIYWFIWAVLKTFKYRIKKAF